MFERLSPYSIGMRNTSMENNWQEINPKKFKIDKPTVICLGGNMSKTPRNANNVCAFVEKLLGINDKSGSAPINGKDINIMGVSYGEIKNEDVSGILGGEIPTIVNDLFIKMFTERGGKLDTKEAIRRASNITLFGHCYGAMLADRFISILDRDLYSYGYKYSEVQAILSEITSIYYGVIEKSACKNPTIVFKSFGDPNVRLTDDRYDPFDFKGIITNKSGNFMEVLSQGLLNGECRVKDTDEHRLVSLGRNTKWEHEINEAGNKYYGGKNADCVSQMMAYALATSIATGLKNTYLMKNSKVKTDKINFVRKPTINAVYEHLMDIKSSFSEDDLEIQF